MNKHIEALRSKLGNFRYTLTDKGDYIRAWNPYSGTSAYRFTRAIQNACEELGLKWIRVRTVGNGMVNMSDWEDRITA